MIAATVAALLLIPAPIVNATQPDLCPPKGHHHMRDTRPITRCTFKGCIAVGHWQDGRCPMHEGATGARVATPELIAEIDARHQR